MKRALSLIIALAMVLCMIPFSAFAADFDTANDFPDGETITLPANEEVSYLWTATEDGTLEIFAQAVVPEVAEGEEIPALAEPYILVDGADYTAAIEVKAGESYEITIGDDAMIGGDVTVWTVLTGLPGTETNPYDYYNPASGLAPADQAATTVSVEPGASVYYNLHYYGGSTLRISGVGVKAVKVWENNTIDGTEAGYVEFEISTQERVVLIKITNKDTAAQTYTFEAIVPTGTMGNEEVVTEGEYTVELAEGGEYWYKYVATAAGKLSIGVAATTTVTDEEGNESVVDCWQYTVNPMSGGTTHYCDDPEIVNPETIDVVAGDEVVFVVATYSSTSRPAATVTTTVSFEEAAEGPIVIDSLPYQATHSGVYEQAYTYTATENGYLYIASEGWMEVNVAGTVWAEGYKDGYVLAMNAGDVANINLYAYWGEETFVYDFSWMSEIEPDGSYGFPFQVGTLLNGEVTLTNDGEDAVYYTYTAEKTGKIYNSFYASAQDVVEGEVVSFYVPAGEPVTIYYLPTVAMIGEVEYTSVDEAVAAAVAGDTIVLVANVTVDTLVTLPINVNLDLGANTLTIAGLAAFPGSAITGDLGNAVIVTDNLIANVVEIDGVEYAWTASEAGYILDVYKAPVVGTEEPIVAEYNGEQMGLSAALAAAAASNPTSDNRAVVNLISDATVDFNVVISPYVTLNIAGYKLTAPNVIGLNGSMINAAAPTKTGCTDGGKIYVPSSANVVMSAEIHDGSKDGCKLLPIWNVDHYLFTNIKNEYDTIEDVSGQADYGNCTKCQLVLVKHVWSDNVVKSLVNDRDMDVAENALTFTYEASWDYYGVIKVYQQYVMIGTYVNSATGSYYGGDTGEIGGLEAYTIQNQVVSDTGAIFYGTLFNVE